MLRRFDVNHAVFSLLMDAVMVAIALRLADLARPALVWLPFSQRVGTDDQVPTVLYAVAPLIWVLVLLLFSLYDPRATLTAIDEYRILVLGSGFAGLASAGLLYLSYRDVSRWLFLIFIAMAFGFLLAWRLASRRLAARLGGSASRRRRVVVVGAGEVGQHVGRLVQAHERLGLTLVGYLDDVPASHPGGGLGVSPTSPHTLPRDGTVSNDPSGRSLGSASQTPSSFAWDGTLPPNPIGRGLGGVPQTPSSIPCDGTLPSPKKSSACVAVSEVRGKILGGIADLRQVVQAQQIDEVVVALPADGSCIADVVHALLDIPVHVRVIPTSFTLALDRPAIETFAGVPMIDLRAGPLGEYQRVVKRLFDLATCSVLTLIALPIMGLIALAIKLDTAGPVLFKQQRVGENGKLFTVYKFRTMVPEAETLQAQVNVHDGRGNVIHKRSDDPRVTRVGRFLRRTSLDELPQFFNILKGDMSLVGPRPELPWLVAQYEPWQRRRLVTPPGLTGWWQVNGRSDLPMHLHTDVDLYYVTNYSFWLDLRILWKTIWVVLQGKGAH